MGELVPFPYAARLTRVISIEPKPNTDGDMCQAQLMDFDLGTALPLGIEGPLIYVVNEARHLGGGIPVLRSNACLQRAWR